VSVLARIADQARWTELFLIRGCVQADDCDLDAQENWLINRQVTVVCSTECYSRTM
jgi:hypothetical protein